MKKLLLSILILTGSSLWAQSQKEVSFWVDGLCEMCEKRIETALINSPGVRYAQWTKENLTVKIVYNSKKVSEQRLHEVIAAAGHDTKKVRATDAAYAKVHACCKYRDLDAH